MVFILSQNLVNFGFGNLMKRSSSRLTYYLSTISKTNRVAKQLKVQSGCPQFKTPWGVLLKF